MHILDYITIGIALAFAVSLIAAYAFGSLPLPPERCDRCYQGGGKRLWALAGCTPGAAAINVGMWKNRFCGNKLRLYLLAARSAVRMRLKMES